jgi:hypothetical protein
MMASVAAGRTSRQHAIAWLAHPATSAAVIVMAVNDHLLKAAYGTWWTGKVSDVAGLVLAPALLAVAVTLCAPRIRMRALVPTAIAAVGIGFVVVKSTTVGAAGASAAWTAVAGPSVVLRDPTDLLALPALAVAWDIARRTLKRQATAAAPVETTPPRERASAALGWGVVLPLTVLATVATSVSSDDPSATEIAVVDGVLVAGATGDYRIWSTSTDGVNWAEVPSDQAALQKDLVDRTGGTATSACAETDPDTCFQAVPGRLAVEVSVDGGDTWEIDWEVPDDTREALANQFIGGSVGNLQTGGVAILTTRDGYRVYAANGMDGFAVRDEGGSWERVGFTFFPSSPQPPRPLPRASEARLITWAWYLGVAGCALSFIVLAETGPSPRPRRVGRYAGALALWAAGWGLFAASSTLNASSVRAQAWIGDYVIDLARNLGVVLMLMGAAILLALGGLVAGRAKGTAYGYASAVGLAAGLATAVTAGPLTTRLAVGAAVAVAGTAAALSGQRRPHSWARARPPVPQNPDATTSWTP